MTFFIFYFSPLFARSNPYTRDVTAKTIAEENVAKKSTRTGLSGRASLAIFYARERCDISEKRRRLFTTSAFMYYRLDFKNRLVLMHTGTWFLSLKDKGFSCANVISKTVGQICKALPS